MGGKRTGIKHKPEDRKKMSEAGKRRHARMTPKQRSDIAKRGWVTRKRRQREREQGIVQPDKPVLTAGSLKASRRAAALKGWETRRRRAREVLIAQAVERVTMPVHRSTRTSYVSGGRVSAMQGLVSGHTPGFFSSLFRPRVIQSL